jgi:hypothetical protein
VFLCGSQCFSTRKARPGTPSVRSDVQVPARQHGIGRFCAHFVMRKYRTICSVVDDCVARPELLVSYLQLQDLTHVSALILPDSTPCLDIRLRLESFVEP